MDLPSENIRAILARWCDSQQELYAVVFRAETLHSVTGRLTMLSPSEAVFGDSANDIRIPLTEPFEAVATLHDLSVNSLAITWPDGLRAFVAVRKMGDGRMTTDD
jgi:hypothetical protein